MASNNIPEYLKSGEPARLISVAASTHREARLLSSTLATLSSVPEFAADLLGSIGKKVGKTSKIKCYAEVVFKSKDKIAKEFRPDGLIVVTTGKKEWRALVEAKVDNNELESTQIEPYLDIAKEHEIDAVITISNQFAITPKHPPYTISKGKLKKVALYHWSWTYIATQAEMLGNSENISDPEQSYILSELVRFYQYKDGKFSGVIPYNNMGDSWKEVCEAIKIGTTLKKTSKEVISCIGSWHQFIRNNAISLGLEIGVGVDIVLPKTHRDKPDKHIADEATKLASDKMLVAEFEIKDAAGKITLTTHLDKQQITASMQIQAPDDRATSKGRINWLLGQLKKAPDKNDLRVWAIWPRKIETTESLVTLRLYGHDQLIGDNTNIVPVAFRVALTKKINWKEFTGQYKFVTVAETVLLEFYDQAGQHIERWVAPPPKIRAESKEESATIEEGNKSIAPATTEITIHNLGAPSGSKPDGGQ